jgi:rubrerythrin
LESNVKTEQLNDLILQSLEHEMGGVKVYETAVQCAINDELKEEWEKYLDETRNHVRILRAKKSKIKRTSTSITPRDGAASYGSSLLV